MGDRQMLPVQTKQIRNRAFSSKVRSKLMPSLFRRFRSFTASIQTRRLSTSARRSFRNTRAADNHCEQRSTVHAVDIAAAVTSLEAQRAALALLAERMRVIRRLVPRPKSAHWAGVANALYEYRL